jgi:tetratricopeptide (TPR) repeat protein
MPTLPAVSHYYQGAALGFQARAFVSQRRYALAIPKARQGVSHIQKALALDPALIDGKLGVGLYYYYLSRVPRAAKPLAYMMVGMWGDRAKGLSLIKEVSLKGQSARREAESLLAAIYASQKERDWDAAIPLLQDLMARYPRNPRYRVSLVYVLQRKGLWEKAEEAADSEGPWVKDLDPLIGSRTQDLLRYREAENRLFANRVELAKPILDRLDADPISGRLKEWVALRLGNYWDAAGKKQTAKAFYGSIRDTKAKALVDVFLKDPFPGGPRDVMPNWWPLATIPE